MDQAFPSFSPSIAKQMNFLLLILVSLTVVKAAFQQHQAKTDARGRSKSLNSGTKPYDRKAVRSQSPNARGSRPLIQQTKAKVRISGPGAYRTTENGYNPVDDFTNEYQTKFRSISDPTASAVRSSVVEGGTGAVKVKGERTHFIATSGDRGSGAIVAKGNGHLVGTLITPTSLEKFDQVVRGHTAIPFGPNSHLQGIHSNVGPRRGRVSVTGLYAGGAGVSAVAENRDTSELSDG